MTSNRWLMLGALFLARTSLGFQFQTVATVAPLLVSDLGINFTEVGTLIGFFSALGFATALPAGLAGKRFGEKRAVLFGLGLIWAASSWRVLTGSGLPALDASWSVSVVLSSLSPWSSWSGICSKGARS